MNLKSDLRFEKSISIENIVDLSKRIPAMFPGETPAYIRAKMSSMPDACLVVSTESCAAVFRKDEMHGLSVVGDCAVIGDLRSLGDLEKLFGDILDRTGWSFLYFPLVYGHSHSAGLLSNVPKMLEYSRNSSPFIEWDKDGKEIASYCKSVIGSQYERRIRRFQKAGFRIRTVCEKAAIDAIVSIEKRSWKFCAGIDVSTRKQVPFFNSLVYEPGVRIRVVYSDRTAVAYRVDLLVGKKLFCLKWSFNEDFARFSPGFYLLAYDLVQDYRDTTLEIVDLYGSPDSLKNSLTKTSYERKDFIWPLGESANQKMSERVAHDQLYRACSNNKKTLRSVFGAETK